MDLDAARRAAEAYGRAVQDPRLAEAAARETLRTCRAALEVLSRRLGEVGFPRVRGVLPRAPRSTIESVAEVLGRPPPRILALFWEEVGGVELVQYEGYGHVDFFRDRGILTRQTTDALVVDAPSDDWVAYLGDELEGFRDLLEEEAAHASPDAVSTFLIPLAPDHLHKDNISGGGPYGIALGDDDWVPRFAGDFEWVAEQPSLAGARPDFVSYLRAAVLECAGFPGLLGVPGFDPLRRSLTAGLPPF